jgi:anti-anti-sigma factor
MEIHKEKFENFTLIKVLAKKLETDLASALKSELITISGRGEKNLILDLSSCNYCDSNGLSAIMIGRRLCTNTAGTFILSGLNGQVEKLIEEAHLNTVIKIARTVRDAEVLIKAAG